MARPRKMISLEEQIKKQEETVLKVKEKYVHEFKGASKSINLLLVFMLILFLSGLGLIIISGGN